MMDVKDLKQIADRGMTVEQVEKQLEELKNGFPFLKIQAAATVDNGILRIDDVHRTFSSRNGKTIRKQATR
jgi:ribosomal protein L29